MGIRMNPFTNENSKAEWSSKDLQKMISADAKAYIKQRERNGGCIL